MIFRKKSLFLKMTFCGLITFYGHIMAKATQSVKFKSEILDKQRIKYCLFFLWFRLS